MGYKMDAIAQKDKMSNRNFANIL